MAKVILNVPDISCEHCEQTILKALTPVQGVEGVQVDISAKDVAVDYDASVLGVDRLKHILADEDYPVASVSEPAA